jgi:aclacinomycin oxidase
MSTRQATDGGDFESIRIGPDDPRYRAVVEKRFNKRFRANPDYVRLVRTTDQVVAAVQEAVQEGRRLAVTSGGHCLEGFVSDPEVRVIIDVLPMKGVAYDPEKRAVAIECGVTVGEAFRALHDRWYRSASIPRSASAGTWSGVPSASSAASSASRRTISTRSRWSP